MANDYFPMAGPGEEPEGAPPEGSAAKPEGETKSEDQGPTALVPKSLLGGKDFQPGEEVVFKIVALRGDEVEIAYATEKPEAKPAGPTADEEIDQMASAGPGGMMGGGY